MLKGVLILDTRGDILVDKSQGSGVTKADIEILRGSLFVNKKISPISEFYGTIYLAHRVNDVLILGICNEESNTAFAAELIVQLVSYCEEYLREPLTENKIKTDFATIYKVIDQFLVDGYPMAADFSSLTTILPLPQVSKNRWSFKDKQYANVICCEIYDAFFDHTGHISLLQIRGSVSLDAKLDPKQQCNIEYIAPPQDFQPIYNNKVIVNLSNGITSMTISQTQTTQPLMTYTLEMPHLNSLPVFIKPIFQWQKTGIRVEVEVKIGPSKPNLCYISFENPPKCLQPSLATNVGTLNYLSESRIATWELPGEAQDCRMSGWIPYDPQFTEIPQKTEIITVVRFRIFGPLSTGFTIKDVSCSENDDIINKSMKYQTCSGRYEFVPIE